MKVLILNGSPRKDGATATLAGETARVLEKNSCEAIVEHLNDWQFPKDRTYYDEDKLRPKVPRALKELYDQVLLCDVLVVMTPTYWMSRSSLTQLFMEFLTVFELNREKPMPLYGKHAFVVATGTQGGQMSVAANLATALSHFGYSLPPFGILWYDATISNEQEWMRRIPELIAEEVHQDNGSRPPIGEVHDW